MEFCKQGPKRRRYTRRELPYGQISLWGHTVTNFKREREAARNHASEAGNNYDPVTGKEYK